MADQDLTVKVIADTTGAVSPIDALNARVAAMEQAFIKASAATTAHGAAQTKSAESVKESGNAAEALVSKLGAVGGASTLVSEGLERMGIEAGGAGAALGLAGEAVEAFASKAPLILALGTAAAAAAAEFLFLKDSIDVAAQSQAALVSIGALVRNQGGAWEENTKAVTEYSEALGKVSIFSRGDALEGMKGMILYGVSVNDTLRSQAAAEDLAAAKGESLQEAEQQLALAYDGRLRSMKMLGLVTAQEVKDGIPYEELLSRIESRMGGTAAAALETYSGKQKQLADGMDSLKDSIGTGLLPLMTDWEDALRMVLLEAQPLTDEFQRWVTSEMPSLREGIAGFAKAFEDAAQVALPAVISMMETALEKFAELGQWMGSHEEEIRSFFYVVLAAGSVAALSSLVPLFEGIITGLTTTMAYIGGTSKALQDLAIQEALASGGMTLLVAGVVIGTADILAHWNEVSGGAAMVWDSITSGAQNMTNAVKGFFGDIGKAYSDFLQSMIDSVPVFGQIANAVRGYYQARSDSEKKYLDYESHKAYGGNIGSNLLSGGSAPLGGSAVAGPTSGGWGTQPFGDEGGVGAGSFGSYTGPPITLPSHHQITGTSTAKGAGKGAGVTETYTDLDPYTQKTDAAAEAQARLGAALKALDASLDSDRAAVKNAMTVSGEADANRKLESDTIAELAAKHKLLNDAIAAENAAVPRLDAANAIAIANYDSLVGAVNEYNEKLRTQGTPATIDQQNALAELKSKAEAAKTAITTTAAAITENTNNTRANTDALLANAKAQADMGNAAADAARKIDAANIAATAAWETYTKKTASQLAEDATTFGLSNAQKFSYYTKMLDDMGAANADNEKEEERVDGLRVTAYKGALADMQKAYEAQVEAEKKIRETESKDISTFLDDIVIAHKSFSDELKSIWDGILKNYLDTLGKQISGGAGFQSIFHPGGANSTTPFGGLLGGAAGAAPDGTPGKPLHVVLTNGTDAGVLSQFTGNSSGISSNSLTAAYNSSASSALASGVTDSAGSALDATGANNFGFGTGNYGSGDPADAASSAVSSSLSGAIAKAMSGAAVGGAISSMLSGLFTGQNDSGIGGSIGGAIGGVVGGPLGSVIGGAAGSLFGGLFGSHETAAQQPDLNNPSYGSFVSNWQGMTGQFGNQTVNPSNQYNTSLGGQSQEVGMLAELKSILAPNSGAASGLVAMAKQLQALAGSDTASNALSITGEKQGNFTLGSGTVIPVAQFMAMVQQFQSASGNAGSIPTFSISRPYGSPSGGTLVNDGTTPSAGTALATNATVNITVNGSIVGANGMQQLATAISAELYSAARGTSPSSGRTTAFTRTGAGF